MDVDHDGNCFYKAISLIKNDNQEEYIDFKKDLVYKIENTNNYKELFDSGAYDKE